MSAAPWLLLRGLAREARHWGPFTQAMQRAFPDNAILTADLPGAGALHRLRSPVRVSDMAEHYRRQLRECGTQPPYRLLALSLGGMVAVEWATAHPEEVESMALINTSLRGLSPFYRRLRPSSLIDLMRFLGTGGDAEKFERVILRRSSRLHRCDAAVIADWAALRRESPVSLGNATRQLWAAARFRAPAVAPRVPALLLASVRDALVDPRCSADIAARWQLPLALHPSAGHDLPLDDGNWVIREIGEWLGRRQASSE